MSGNDGPGSPGVLSDGATIPDQRLQQRPRAQDEQAAESVERAWRGEIPAVAKHGEIGNGRSRDGATISTPNDSDSVLARLKRDDPELAARMRLGVTLRL